MLDGWHEFYGLLGTAAAALLALLFVAASIGATVFTAESSGATSTFMSPVVFHYSNIMFLSLVALIPTQTWESFGLVLLVAATASAIYSIFIMYRLIHNDIADFGDRLAYGLVPVVAYVTGLYAAYLILNESKAGLEVLAGDALALLVVNIRNAWDLMISLARKSNEVRLSEKSDS
jgi:hypothetical protein